MSNQNNWTLETLKEALEKEINNVRGLINEADRRYSERFLGQEKAVESALQSAKDAVTKAELATEKRFESVNEFRKTLADQTNTLMSRNEYLSSHSSLLDKVDSLTTRIAAVENLKKGGELTMGKIYAAIVAVGAVLTIIVLISNNLFK